MSGTWGRRVLRRVTADEIPQKQIAHRAEKSRHGGGCTHVGVGAGPYDRQVTLVLVDDLNQLERRVSAGQDLHTPDVLLPQLARHLYM